MDKLKIKWLKPPPPRRRGATSIIDYSLIVKEIDSKILTREDGLLINLKNELRKSGVKLDSVVKYLRHKLSVLQNDRKYRLQVYNIDEGEFTVQLRER